MTESCFKRLEPDGITGMIFMLEGMKNTVTLLNGPMGCRFYHSTTSQFLSVRPTLYLPSGEGAERVPVDYNYLNDWFFRQARVPCTYLDGYDYVYGTADKVEAALRFIKDNLDFDLLAIVNSPGAALIGDNHLEAARHILGEGSCVMLESPGFSTDFEQGSSEALRALLAQAGPALWREREKKGGDRAKVNLLGPSIFHRYCEGDIREMRELFSLCGIEVNAVLCAGCSVRELAAVPDADLNVVLYPRIGQEGAAYLQEELGMRTYLCEAPPVGFSATEKMFREICLLLGRDDSALRKKSEQARALAWYKLNEISQAYGKPKGVRFCVHAGPDLDRAYTAFLRDYLAMQPAEAGDAELLFSDANEIASLMLENRNFCGIEVRQPGMGYVDLLPKTHLGITGGLFLIEQVLNGIMSKL